MEGSKGKQKRQKSVRNVERKRSYPSLCEAIRNNDTAVVKLLLDPERINDPIEFRRTILMRHWSISDALAPLHLAVIEGHEDIVELLLQHKANLNTRTETNPEYGDGKCFRWTALHFAVAMGHHDLVDSLLKAGANPNITDSFGETPIFMAAKNDDVWSCEQLLSKGTSLIDRNTYRQTPFSSAGPETWMLFAKRSPIELTDYADALPKLSACAKWLRDEFDKPVEKNGHYKRIDFITEQAARVLGYTIWNIGKLERKRKSGNMSSRAEYEAKWKIRKLYQIASSILDLPVPYLGYRINEGLRAFEILNRPYIKDPETTLLETIINKSIHVLVQHSRVQAVMKRRLWPDIPIRRIQDFVYRTEVEATSLGKVLLAHIAVPLFGRGMRLFLSAVWLFLLVAVVSTIAIIQFNNNDFNAYELSRHIENSVAGDVFRGIETREQLWEWLENDFVEGVTELPSNSVLGPVILRQLRVQKGSCPTHKFYMNHQEEFAEVNTNCVGTWSENSNDDESFGSTFEFVYLQPSGEMVSGFTQNRYYSDGGFVAELEITGNSSDLSAQISNLKNKNWIDDQTAVVFLEFVVWNANMNVAAVGREIVELLIAGSIVPWGSVAILDVNPYESQEILKPLHIAAFACLIYHFLFEILQILLEITKIVNLGFSAAKKYHFRRIVYRWKDIWNLFDLAIIVLGGLCIWFQVRILNSLNDLKIVSHEVDYNAFAALTSLELEYSITLSILVTVLWFNLFRHLRVFRLIGVLYRIFMRMMKDFFTFILLYWIFNASFGLAFHMLVGNQIFAFVTWGNSMLTLLRMTVTDADWDSIQNTNLSYAKFLFFLYLILSVILLLNLLIAILNQSYSDIMQQAKYEYLQEYYSMILSYGSENPRNYYDPQRDRERFENLPKSSLELLTMKILPENNSGDSPGTELKSIAVGKVDSPVLTPKQPDSSKKSESKELRGSKSQPTSAEPVQPADQILQLLQEMGKRLEALETKVEEVRKLQMSLQDDEEFIYAAQL